MAIFLDTRVSLHSGLYWSNDERCGGDDWIYKTWKAPVKSSPPTNPHQAFYRQGALPVAQQCQCTHSLSIHFKGHFPGEPGLALVLLKLRMVEVVVTTGDISRAKLQSNHRNQQTKT